MVSKKSHIDRSNSKWTLHTAIIKREKKVLNVGEGGVVEEVGKHSNFIYSIHAENSGTKYYEKLHN